MSNQSDNLPDYSAAEVTRMKNEIEKAMQEAKAKFGNENVCFDFNGTGVDGKKLDRKQIKSYIRKVPKVIAQYKKSEAAKVANLYNVLIKESDKLPQQPTTKAVSTDEESSSSSSQACDENCDICPTPGPLSSSKLRCSKSPAAKNTTTEQSKSKKSPDDSSADIRNKHENVEEVTVQKIPRVGPKVAKLITLFSSNGAKTPDNIFDSTEKISFPAVPGGIVEPPVALCEGCRFTSFATGPVLRHPMIGHSNTTAESRPTLCYLTNESGFRGSSESHQFLLPFSPIEPSSSGQLPREFSTETLPTSDEFKKMLDLKMQEIAELIKELESIEDITGSMIDAITKNMVDSIIRLVSDEIYTSTRSNEEACVKLPILVRHHKSPSESTTSEQVSAGLVTILCEELLATDRILEKQIIVLRAVKNLVIDRIRDEFNPK